MTACRANGWPRHLRLRKRPDFVRIQRRGRRLRGSAMTLCVMANRLGHPRFGLTVSRKVGNAVVRNLVKRRLREGLRHLDTERIGSFDVVVLARPDIVGLGTERLGRELSRLLEHGR